MTENEAKKKICPLRKSTFDSVKSAKCAGDDCMWWRWIPQVHRTAIKTKDRPFEGYCGLAGTPHV